MGTARFGHLVGCATLFLVYSKASNQTMARQCASSSGGGTTFPVSGMIELAQKGTKN